MKKYLTLLAPSLLLSGFLAFVTHAQDPKFYPFTPPTTDALMKRVVRFTENTSPLMNVHEMEARSIMKAGAANSPWGGFFWSMMQGQTANTYHGKNFLKFWEYFNWEGNVKSWKGHREKIMSRFIDMSEKDLAKLAPSEKYDMVLGDREFDLSNRVWDLVEKWASKKDWGYISSIDIPAGYALPKMDDELALWEGICHGWALAATVYPRPTKTVFVTLPNGKRMPFYPDDMKALVSLMFANSPIQGKIIMEGERCNDKKLTRDEFGRNVDRTEAKKKTCGNDFHPAVFHGILTNVMALEGRSMVVEVDAHAVVNNHPMSSFEYQWFNPKTGKKGDLSQSMMALGTFDDLYRESRNPEATHVVGVSMKMNYVNWQWPKKEDINTVKDDDFASKKFLYDLELDAQGNIVGGQWRADEKLKRYDNPNDAPKILHPDFVWILPRDYQKDFKLEPLAKSWDGNGFAPSSWLAPAQKLHGEAYYQTRQYNLVQQCTVFNQVDGSPLKVPCEYVYPRPQPLRNVVEKLVELSRQ